MAHLQEKHPDSALPPSSPSLDGRRENHSQDFSHRQASDAENAHENAHHADSPMNTRRFLAIAALACVWSGAQAPLFLFAGVPVEVYRDIGGVDHWIWFVTAHLIAIAAISPFVGALSDIFGRRYVVLAGNLLLLLGQVTCGVAKTMDVFIGGMALTGVGSGINELTALAGTAELAPVSQRGYYVAGMITAIIPLMPSVMYAQLIATTAGWRYISVVTGVWAFIGLLMTFIFYSPPRPATSEVLTFSNKLELLGKMDFVGGSLSILGLALFEVGLLWGGYQYPWASSHVLAPLILGILLVAAFGLWENRWAQNPMIPRRLGKAPRTLILTLVITFISGANFFSVLMLWPSEAYNVYGHDPVGVGLRGMPFAFGVFGGCLLSLVLLSWSRGNIKWLLCGTSCVMTAGCGALAVARVDNINTMYAILFIAGLGVGGIVVPASTITTIICPSDLIATITALTISIRIIGGAVGYAIYYNVFVNKLVPELTRMVGGACARNGITDIRLIGPIIELTGASLLDEIRALPWVTETTWHDIVAASQIAYANAYPWVYYCSIAFGSVAIVASLLLEDISEFINDDVAVAL